MVIQMHGRQLYLAGDEGGGGTGTAVVDAPAGGDSPETPDAGAAEGTPEGTETPTPEAGTEGAAPAEGRDHPAGTGRTYTDSDMAGLRRSLEAKFEKKLQETIDGLRQSLTGEVSTLRKDVDTLKPPPKDPLDAWIESLPEGEEGTPEYERRQDLLALSKHLKDMRPHLLPDVGEIKGIQAGLAVSFDKLRFLSEELIAFAKEVSEAMATGDPEAMRKVKLPVGLTHLEKVEAARKETFEKSGRTVLPTYRGTFESLMKTVQNEEASAVKTEAEIRADERARLEREKTQRKAAAGAPGNVAPAPRGAGAPKGGRRTPDDINRANQEGTGFLLP